MAEDESNQYVPGEGVAHWFKRLEINSEIESWDDAVPVNVVIYNGEILSITGPFPSVPDALAAALVQAEELRDDDDEDGDTQVLTKPLWSP